MKKICFLNNGCGGHITEFRKICKDLENSYELTKFPGKADVIVSYFCAIAQDRIKSIAYELAYLSRVKKKGAKLIICGCAPETMDKDVFEDFDFVDYVIGRENIAKQVLNILGFEYSNQYYLGDNPTIFSWDIVGGCKKKGGWCKFCKQNYMKIPVKSMPIDEICKIASEVTNSRNTYAISLTGLNICNYGIDIGDKKPKLHLLIRELSKIPTVKIIDLYSLTVADMYEELIEEIEINSKIGITEMGIQSGSNYMLKTMNTSSTVEECEAILNRFSNKAMQSMVVVGHPGETMERVHETVDFILKNNLWYVHIGPFENTEGTPSYSMEQLNEEDYEYNVRIVSQTVLNLRKKFLDGLIGSKIQGYFFRGEVCKHNDKAYIYMETRKSFFATLVLIVEKFSTNDDIENILQQGGEGKLLETTVTEVLDYEKIILKVENVEAVDNEDNK